MSDDPPDAVLVAAALASCIVQGCDCDVELTVYRDEDGLANVNAYHEDECHLLRARRGGRN